MIEVVTQGCRTFLAGFGRIARRSKVGVPRTDIDKSPSLGGRRYCEKAYHRVVKGEIAGLQVLQDSAKRLTFKDLQGGASA